MKRIICLILAGVMLLCLTACSANSDDMVSFYYLRHSDEFIYGAQDGVIALEKREIAGRNAGLDYLFRLYLEGPLDSALTAPYPKGTQLIRSELKHGTLSLELSREFCALEGFDLTLAYACIATTGFALTDAEQIQISATSIRGETKSITLSRDSLTLLDDSIPATDATEVTGQ